MKYRNLFRLGVLLVSALLLLGISLQTRSEASAAGSQYVILGWNDLGMHCYNKDFSDMAVLPPYNTMWVQVVKKGNPPRIITKGIKVFYNFPGNTYSAGKTNFWDYEDKLFGVNLPANVGLTGKKLSGTMNLKGDHYAAEGIPITEFSDAAPTTPNPFQKATITVKNLFGVVLARTTVVAPVSSEMRCDYCHSDGGAANPAVATGKVDTNILTLHDQNESTSLMDQRPVLCATCHGSNALGMGGDPTLPNLSNAMHNRHTGKIPDTLSGCYNCHPGPKTKCLRDVMSQDEGMDCIDCHGGMAEVAKNPNPWLNEPRCDSCHDEAKQDQALYRFSKGHGGLYCEACHDSTHAIAPSRVSADGIKFRSLQGHDGPLDTCTVCHLTKPSSGGPHEGSGGD